MRIKGNVEIHRIDSKTNQTKEIIKQNNLVPNSSLIGVLDWNASPGYFGNNRISISSSNTIPSVGNSTLTNIIATGYIPAGITSPIWNATIDPPFGQIQNRINFIGSSRVFNSVGLTLLGSGDVQNTSATVYAYLKLDTPCTQGESEYLDIYYRIQFVDSGGDGYNNLKSARYDFGKCLILGTREFNMSYEFALPFPKPSSSYKNVYTGDRIGNINSGVISETVLNRYYANTTSIPSTGNVIASHYKFKSVLTLAKNTHVGLIINSILKGLSIYSIWSAYNVAKFKYNEEPFQTGFWHSSTATGFCFDANNAGSSNGKITLSGTWVNKWPELYKFIITASGATGVATYKFSVRKHLGFTDNNYNDRPVPNPFRNPGVAAADGQHGWRDENNDVLQWSNTKIVQYDDTGVTLLDLFDGTYTNWDATTTPALTATQIRQCVVDPANSKIYVGCRNLGLYIIDTVANTVTLQLNNPCYGVDIGKNGVVTTLISGGLYRSTDWTTPVSFNFTGISDGNWSRVWFLKADPEHINDRIAIVTDNGSGVNRIVWKEFNTVSTSPPLATPYWRLKNKVPATGGDSQWIVRELVFKDELANDITSGGISTGASAFDKNNSTYSTVGAGNNLTLQYTFASSVVVYEIAISNLNNGSNIPPTNYDLEYSPDNLNWSTAFNFTIGTNDSQYYSAKAPYSSDAGTSAGYQGIEIKKYSASLDVSDTGSFWASNASSYTFGSSIRNTLSWGVSSKSLTHSIFGLDNYYKINFYNGNLICNDRLVSSTNTSIVTYTALDTNGFPISFVLHMDSGIIFTSSMMRQMFTDNAYCYTDYGWNGTAWVAGNTNSKTSHATDQALINGLQNKFTDGASVPQFTSTNYLTQSVNYGILKDNASDLNWSSCWYSLPTELYEPVIATVPSTAPYTVTLAVTTDPLFIRMETDSPELHAFTLNGIPVTKVYVDGSTPAPGEISMQSSGDGVLTFNAANNGLMLGGTYTWIKF